MTQRLQPLAFIVSAQVLLGLIVMSADFVLADCSGKCEFAFMAWFALAIFVASCITLNGVIGLFPEQEGGAMSRDRSEIDNRQDDRMAPGTITGWVGLAFACVLGCASAVAYIAGERGIGAYLVLMALAALGTSFFMFMMGEQGR